MTETLTIRNFGPIKDVTIELRSVNVFIGDQGTGKSTVAKVLCVVTNCFHRDLFDVAQDANDRQTLVFLEYLKFFDIASYVKAESEIYYSDHVFKFSFLNGRVAVRETGYGIDQYETVQYNFNYIIAERSLVVTLESALYGLIQTKTSLPQLFLRLGNKFQSVRKSRRQADYTHILGIVVSDTGDGKDITLKSGDRIYLSNSSTGMQNAIPLLMIFDNVSELWSGKSGQVKDILVLEEPEINLFPRTQYEIIKHIIKGVKNKPELLTITTHSPYVLASLNNLMSAHNAGKLDAKSANEVIPEKYWLNPDDVSAYMMLPDGTCEDIMDREENMIKAEKIDDISGILNEQFDKLLGIEFEHNK